MFDPLAMRVTSKGYNNKSKQLNKLHSDNGSYNNKLPLETQEPR